MNDKFARVLTGLAVLAVAVIAAIVSFTHIASVAAGHGYTPATAKLLPFSVDGLIVAASLVLLAEARAHRPAPRLARAGLWLGICATLAANIEHGAAYGLVGALVNAWPGAAFVLASEILLGMIRRAGTTQGVPEERRGSGGCRRARNRAGERACGWHPYCTAGQRQDSDSRRARRRASRAPERVFAAELEQGELPSLRAIKSRAKCGTDRARAIREQLSEILRERVSEAA